MPEKLCCATCVEILGSMARRHEVGACPIQRGCYCGVCAAYGHSASECPDSRISPFREPQFVEQLVPPSLLEAYGITSRTPLPLAAAAAAPAAAPPHEQPLWEVPETDEALRAALLAVGGKPMICQEKGRKEKTEITENKRRLQKIADTTGRRLVFVTPGRSLADLDLPPLEAPVTTKPKKKTAGKGKANEGNTATGTASHTAPAAAGAQGAA